MDNQQEQRINEAAEKFADAVTESYRTVSERSVSAQELNTQLTQNFFNGVIQNLRSQAERNRQITEQLADQQQRQREAAQALTQESVNTYMQFVNSMFSYYQGNVEQAQSQASEAGSSGSATGVQASEAAAPERSPSTEVQASEEAAPETSPSTEVQTSEEAAPEMSPSSATETQTSGEAEVTPDTSSESVTEESADAEALLENYDSMNVRKVSEKLDELSVEEIRQLRDYEVQNKNRRTLIERFDLRLDAGS